MPLFRSTVLRSLVSRCPCSGGLVTFSSGAFPFNPFQPTGVYRREGSCAIQLGRSQLDQHVVVRLTDDMSMTCARLEVDPEGVQALIARPETPVATRNRYRSKFDGKVQPECFDFGVATRKSASTFGPKRGTSRPSVQHFLRKQTRKDQNKRCGEGS